MYLNYQKENQIALDQVSIKELKKLIRDGHFSEGSMLPKVEAAIEFVKEREGRKVVITSLNNLSNVDITSSGTVIHNE